MHPNVAQRIADARTQEFLKEAAHWRLVKLARQYAVTTPEPEVIDNDLFDGVRMLFAPQRSTRTKRKAHAAAR